MKKRKLNFIVISVLSLFLCGCQDDGSPQIVNKYEHDIDDAVAMIDEIEWDCAWLQTQDVIARSDAEALITHLDSMADGIGEHAVSIQMDLADWENDSIKELILLHENIHPTIYHKGISVTSATEEHHCEVEEGTDNCKFHIGTLTIRKEYKGDNEALKGWYLEYIFQQVTHDGEWSFVCFNGKEYNLSKTDANLKLKKSFYKANYDTSSFYNPLT